MIVCICTFLCYSRRVVSPNQWLELVVGLSAAVLMGLLVMWLAP